MPTSVTSSDIEAQVQNTRQRQPRHSSKISARDRKIPKTKAPKYGDASATYWKLYRSEAEINDKRFVDSLKGNTDSMVFLNTLFSSIVASFIIETYKTFQTAGGPSSRALRINIVLFLSLFLSIVDAVTCALLLQWCNEYLMFAYPRRAPYDAGRVRTYLFRGLRRFQMKRLVYGTHVLLHISVFLFFWALSDFFYTVDHHFGHVIRYTLVGSAIGYILFSIAPVISGSCPYNTPITHPLRAGITILRIIIRFPKWFPKWRNSKPFDLTGLEYYQGIRFDREQLYSMKARKQAKKLEPYAMKWLFTEDHFSDDVMDKFLEGLPGYISSNLTEEHQLDEYLAAEPILARIKEHFITCATSVELSNKASIDRVSFCVKALQRVFEYSRDCKANSPELENVLQSQKAYIQELVEESKSLTKVDDPIIALRVSCIVALAVQDLLSELDLPASKMANCPRFPSPLVPLYTFLFEEDITDSGPLTTEENRRIWDRLLHDGPVANLTTLGQSILDSETKEGDAPPSTLSFCWETLDIVLAQIRATHSRVPPSVQNHFDNLHETTRTFHSGVRGFRVKPLLDILDTVARGRRFLMVFSSHPTYHHNRVDVEFGKEDLRNGDLLEAFARCLPDFISKNNPEVRGDFMEKVIRDDDLWASLQMNLRNTQSPDSPTPDKLRVFKNCCTVLDVALSVLEDSRKVDWRAREFESLLQQFESMITHFRGAYIGTTRFRVGVIKARFCKALLAQFWNDSDNEGIVSFRSQWGVVSLARLICAPGLQDEDAEFRNSYFRDFTVKAPEMIEILCDWPLLIFCQLGNLVTTAVPLDQSGIKFQDIEKVWELQERVIQNTPLSLDRVSNPVSEALGRLQKKVDGLRVENKGKDEEILQRLLRMIDGVTISVARHSTSLSAESTGIRSKQFSFASDSTVVTGGPFSGSQNSDGEDGFEKRPADKVLDREKTDVRSESPQSYKSGFHSPLSRHPTYPSLVSRASTNAGPSTLHRDAHTVRSDKGQSGTDPTSNEE